MDRARTRNDGLASACAGVMERSESEPRSSFALRADEIRFGRTEVPDCQDENSFDSGLPLCTILSGKEVLLMAKKRKAAKASGKKKAAKKSKKKSSKKKSSM